jgi:hypothetical protein
VADLDTQIDALYQLPLSEFTSARRALAKTLSGEQARQVRALKKPTAVPWTVNQVYWKARSVYDAAMKAGHSLRTAQIATLQGKKADVRAATDTHRRAIAAAVHQAVRVASTAGLKPNTEQLARMFEAVSLAAAPPPAPGRFLEVIAPSGFDALTGVTPARRVHEAAMPATGSEKDEKPAVAPKIDRAAERRRLEQERRERREAEARLRTAARELEHARARAQTAREALEHAETAVEAAERALAEARAATKES